MDGPDTLPGRAADTSPLQALVDLGHAVASTARFEDVLALAAEQARLALGADGLALARWERDRGSLRTLVNVGVAAAGHGRFPAQERYAVAEYADIIDFDGRGGVVYHRGPGCPPEALALLERLGRESVLSLQVQASGRQWGEMFATTRRGGRRFGQADLARAREVAHIVGQVIGDAEQLQQLSRLAYQDPLTGVANRRVLDDTLAVWLAADGPGATVVLCDVNGLKVVNDSRGHEAGDRAILAVADSLAQAVAGLEDFVLARVGGDEFAVALRGPARTRAVEVVESTARYLEVASEPTSVSCGVATAPAGTAPRVLMNAADDAQYAAKRRHAQVVVASTLDRSDVARVPRPRWVAPTRRVRRDPVPGATVAAAVAALAEGSIDSWADLPATCAGRLRWLGERLMAPCQLEQWSLSRVDGSGALVSTAMGMLRARTTGRPHHDVMVDDHFVLADYPVSARAIAAGAVFVVEVDDEDADPAERAVLREMGVRYVVGLGLDDGDQQHLLELHGDRVSTPSGALADLLVLAATAVLARPVSVLGDAPAAVPSRASRDRGELV